MTYEKGPHVRARPVLVDCFGCEGGAAEGYWDAGFEVWSVDNDKARAARNRHTWFVGDWREGLDRALQTGRVTALAGSPPCQAYSVTRHTHDVYYPELVSEVRDAFAGTGLPYVIENVVGAPMIDPLVLCGTHFALTTLDLDGSPLYLRRHRLFESNVTLTAPSRTFIPMDVCGLTVQVEAHIPPQDGTWDGQGNIGCLCMIYNRAGYKCAGVYGGGSADRNHAEHVRRGGYTPGKLIRSALLGGVPWMTLRGQSESLPPAYTRHLGIQVLAEVERRLAVAA